MRTLSTFPLLTACAVGLVASACASKPPTSGFLNDYDRLEPSPFVDGVYVYRNAENDVSNYRRFLVEPVVVFLHPEHHSEGLPADDLKKLTDFFREAMVEALDDGYDVVESAAPGVLRIRAAITDVIPSNKYWAIHPFTFPLAVGGATVEAEFADSESGEVVAAVLASRRGKGYRLPKNLTPWAHAKSVLREWATLLRERLDEIHAEKAAGEDVAGSDS